MKTLSKIIKFIQGHPVTILALIIILLVITIYLCFRNYGLKHQLSRYQPNINSSVKVVSTSTNAKGKEVQQTTTVAATDAKFSIAPSYTGIMQPSQILYWDSKIRPGSSFGDKDTADLQPDSSRGSLRDFYFRDFVPTPVLPGGWSSNQDSLVQLLLDRKSLELSFYNQGVQKYLTKTYPLDLERYKYNWTPSYGLTYENKPLLEIGPYVNARYQIFNKVPTVSTGIQFKTRKLDYNIGISSSYDERYTKPFKFDVEISVTYRFKKWLK